MKIGLTGIAFKPFWGFTQEQYQRRKLELRQLATAWGASLRTSPTAFEDASGALQAAKLMNSTDLAMLDVATFPEGKAAFTFLERLQVPLVLWSRDESVHGTHIGHNSFCGANFLAGNLALKLRRFRSIHGSLSSPLVRAKLRTAVRLIAAAKVAQGATIGLFGGGIVPKFYDIDISEKDRAELNRRYRIKFVNIPLADLVARAAGYKQDLIERTARSLARRFGRVEVPGEALSKQARILQALRDLTKEGNFAAIAVRCWPELQSQYGAWPCPALSLLNDLGVPAACEGDPGGALDMLLASKLVKSATTLLDIVDWDDRKNSLSIWHCGPTACSWAATNGTRLKPHNVDGRTTQGRPTAGLPAIVDMEFAPGKVTLFRTLGALDDEFALEAEIVPAKQLKICGSFGTITRLTAYGQPISTSAVREVIMTRALPHHYTAARGHLFA